MACLRSGGVVPVNILCFCFLYDEIEDYDEEIPAPLVPFEDGGEDEASGGMSWATFAFLALLLTIVFISGVGVSFPQPPRSINCCL